MNDDNVLETQGRLRVRLDYMQGPDEPYDDYRSPLLRIEPGGYRHVEHIQVGNMRPTGDDERIEEAALRWGGQNSSEWAKFEKYLRAYHGVTQIVTYWSDSYWYVTYDSKPWRDAVGAEPGTASLDDYKFWCEGEVYGYVVEKRVTWRAVNPETDDPDYSEYQDMDTWETVEALGTYYGWDSAEEAALQAFKEFEGSTE